VEFSPAAADVAETLEGLIARAGGAALFIDYGGDGIGDTLQAVRGHEREGALEHPGEADLTARVDFDAFLAAAGEIPTFGPVSQARFLRTLGLELRAARLAAANPEEAPRIARQVQRLISSTAMGELFQVVCLASPGLVPPGFA
jgi:SAM-dependent MidA family methyltransferase